MNRRHLNAFQWMELQHKLESTDLHIKQKYGQQLGELRIAKHNAVIKARITDHGQARTAFTQSKV